MLFPTIEFGLFLVVALTLVWGAGNNNLLRKILLLGLSLAFYASWNWRFLFILLASGLISFSVGLCVDASKRRSFRWPVLALGIVLNLGMLIYFKYLDFIIAQILNAAAALSLPADIPFQNITLPVAISFLTFHALSYIIDVYRGKVRASGSLLDVLLYLCFFPHLVAGPIVRAHEFMPQLASTRRLAEFSLGTSLLLILGGLFKKMVIANYLAVRFADPVFTDPSQFSRFDLIMAMYAYAIQIYCDFSAYTDIAIGVAALLGYRFPQNFNQPYRALGFSDFWRRWHMTLSVWLRDYLYIPLGGNRHGQTRTLVNLMITMLLGGLWHGANWTFLIWGAIHGAALVVDHLWQRTAAFARIGGHRLYLAAAWFITFHFVCLAWIFFRTPSLDGVGQFFGGIFQDNGAASTMPWIVVPLLALGGITQVIPARTREVLGAAFDRRGQLAKTALAFAILYVVLLMAPPSSAPFIYYQF